MTPCSAFRRRTNSRTASLDGANREVVLSLIEGAKAQGSAIIGIFHDEDARDRVCDRVIDVSVFAPARGAA